MIPRIIRRVIYGLAAGIVLILLVVAVLYFHTPSWYQPLRLGEHELQPAYDGLGRQLGSLANQAAAKEADEPVRLTITQRQVNEWLQVLPRYSGLVRLPDGLIEPMVVFRKDRLILAGRYAPLSRQPVSLILGLRVEPAAMSFSIESVQIGSLPLPRTFIDDQVSELRHRFGRWARRLADAGARPGASAAVEAGRLLFRMIDGEPIQRDFEHPQARRAMRVESIELDDGKITLELRPRGPAIRSAGHGPAPDMDRLHRLANEPLFPPATSQDEGTTP